MTDYVFHASALLDEQRAAMEQCLDPTTVDRLEAIGVGPGWRCLEVGGGGGSIATWLAERVGGTGYVLATDLDPGGMSGEGPLEVRAHDIVADELPEAAFDLVHARLVLLHLPERDRALARMVRSLRPGGTLLLGEFDCTWMPTLSTARDADAELFGRFHRSLCRLLSGAGADLEWGVHAYRAMAEQGLVGLDSHTRAEPWRGGGAGCRWLHVNSRQLQDRIVETGLMTATDLDGLRDLLLDPGFVVSSYLTISTWGRRPFATDDDRMTGGETR